MIINILVFILIVGLSIGKHSIESDKQEFLRMYGDTYGYSSIDIDDLRTMHFPLLKNDIYLDYTGSGLTSQKQLDDISKYLSDNLLGNPHSTNPSSSLASSEVKATRQAVLQFFNATEDYSVIFTSGTTAALKTLGEFYPWSANSRFLYTNTNHVSVLGIREYVKLAGGRFISVSPDELIDKAVEISREQVMMGEEGAFNIAAFPASSNFEGSKFPLEWASELIKQTSSVGGKSWRVLVDTAAFVSSNRLDLSKYPIDFVAISFYKMFGFPTGLGALLIRNDALNELKKTCFGGGAVVTALPGEDWVIRAGNSMARFEDGTIPFNLIPLVKFGLDQLNFLGIDSIQRHVATLTRYLARSLASLRHSNGSPLLVLYGFHDLSGIDGVAQISIPSASGQAGVVTFNILDVNGQVAEILEFMDIAAENNIHIRAGSHCNYGASFYFTDRSNEDVKSYFERGCQCDGHACYLPDLECVSRSGVTAVESDVAGGCPIGRECWPQVDRGKATGALRISIGYPTTFEDVQSVIYLFKDTYTDYTCPQPGSFLDFSPFSQEFTRINK